MPHSIRKLRKGNYLAKDMYKLEKPSIPTNAGMIVLFTSYISIALLPLIIRLFDQIFGSESKLIDFSEVNLSLLLVVSIYAIYGLIDDLLDIGRKLKLFLPIIFGYPLILVIHPENIWLPIIGDFPLSTLAFSNVTWEDIFRITIIPIYVMVVANLVNMHSGYNGLQSGLSIILISTLLIKSWQSESLSLVMPGAAFLGAIIAFWQFNKYPSLVFEGNIGSLLFGSLIGCIIVIQEFWWFGFFILLPHTLNLVLWTIWLYLMDWYPEIYLEKDGKHRKFGFVREDLKLEVPNRLTLKWIPNYYFNLNEVQSVYIMYSLTIIFCILGLYLF